MKNFIVIAMLMATNYGYAQFGIAGEDSPLSNIEQNFQKKENYLLEKDNFSTPDKYFETLIDQPLAKFVNLKLQSSLNHSQIYQAQQDELASIYGSSIKAEPILHFFEGRLSKVLFEAGEAIDTNLDLYKSLKNKFGKPDYKDKFEIGANGIKIYRWEGYKVNIQLLISEEDGITRKAVVIEDKLMTKLEEADKQQKEFVQQEMLFSDVQSVFR